jgi:hypothetical protein
MDEQLFVDVEQRLTNALISWATASVGIGSLLAIAGHRTHQAQILRFGRQTAAWGAIDGLIAGVGILGRRRRGELTAEQAEKKARSLRTTLLVNAAADVVYVLGGILITARGVRGQETLRMGTGDGLAIVIQGSFLLALDLSQAQKLHEHSRSLT